LFNLFKGKPTYDDFYTANKIAPEKEHLLNIGALLLEYNQGRDSLTLKSRWQPKYLGQLLNDAWGVYDKESSIELLDELLDLPSTEDNEALIQAILVDKQQIPGNAYEVLVNPGMLFDCLVRNVGKAFEAKGVVFNRARFDTITSIAAWDIERAGLVVRYGYNMQWFTEAETISWLEQLYAIATENYPSWPDYYIAYMKGRSLLYETKISQHSDYVFTLEDMYKKDGFFCVKYAM
jgi:hypothetical protein